MPWNKQPFPRYYRSGPRLLRYSRRPMPPMQLSSLHALSSSLWIFREYFPVYIATQTEAQLVFLFNLYSSSLYFFCILSAHCHISNFWRFSCDGYFSSQSRSMYRGPTIVILCCVTCVVGCSVWSASDSCQSEWTDDAFDIRRYDLYAIVIRSFSCSNLLITAYVRSE